MKKLLAIILFVTFIVGFAGVASAAEWEYIHSNRDESLFFDTESLQKTGSQTYVVLIKRQFTEDHGKVLAEKFGYSQVLSHLLIKDEFDYYNQKVRGIYIEVYDIEGNVVELFESDKKWDIISTMSDNDIIFNATYDYYKKHYL